MPFSAETAYEEAIYQTQSLIEFLSNNLEVSELHFQGKTASQLKTIIEEQELELKNIQYTLRKLKER